MNPIRIVSLALMLSLTQAACSSAPKKDSPENKQKTEDTPRTPKAPLLTRSEIRVMWIPDKIEGDRYIEGHFVHILEKKPSWSSE